MSEFCTYMYLIFTCVHLTERGPRRVGCAAPVRLVPRTGPLERVSTPRPLTLLDRSGVLVFLFELSGSRDGVGWRAFVVVSAPDKDSKVVRVRCDPTPLKTLGSFGPGGGFLVP